MKKQEEYQNKKAKVTVDQVSLSPHCCHFFMYLVYSCSICKKLYHKVPLFHTFEHSNQGKHTFIPVFLSSVSISVLNEIQINSPLFVNFFSFSSSSYINYALLIQ